MSGSSNTPTTPAVFGPKRPTRLDCMGIRYFFPEPDPGGGGGGFTPINTQEEFNTRIQERVARAEKPYEALKGLDVADVVAKYSAVKDLDVADLQAKAAELATVKANQGATEADLNGKITAAEQRATTAEAKATADETTIADLQAKLLRYDVAAENGLPLSHAGRLVGATKEELDADAKEFKKTLRTPGYDPGQGHQDGGVPVGADGNAEADRRFGKTTT